MLKIRDFKGNIMKFFKRILFSNQKLIVNTQFYDDISNIEFSYLKGDKKYVFYVASDYFEEIFWFLSHIEIDEPCWILDVFVKNKQNFLDFFYKPILVQDKNHLTENLNKLSTELLEAFSSNKNIEYWTELLSLKKQLVLFIDESSKSDLFITESEI